MQEGVTTHAPDADGRVAHDTGVFGMVLLAYGTVARELDALLSVVARVLLPIAVVLLATGLLGLGRGAVLRNGELALVESPPGSATTGAVVLVALGSLGLFVAIAACTLVVAGALVGRTVPAGAACRLALRRLPALAGLLVAAALVVALPLAILLLPIPVFFGVVVLVIGGLLAAPYGLALPVAALERRGPVDAIRRADQIIRGRRTQAVIVLLVGIVPAGLVAIWLLPAWLEGLEGSGGLLARAVLPAAVGLAMIPFQAGVLAVTAVWAITDPAAVRADLPDAQQPRLWQARLGFAVALALLLALPGLLYRGYVAANPLDLVTVTEHSLSTPTTWVDLTLHVWSGAPPAVAVAPGYPYIGPGPNAILVCDDDACTSNHRLEGDYSATAATPPDGTIVVAAWRKDFSRRPTRDQSDGPEDGQRLDLLTCPAGNCDWPADWPELDFQPDAGVNIHNLLRSAVAVSDSRVTVASLTWPEPDPDSLLGRPALLRLTACDDTSCAQQQQRTLAAFEPGRGAASQDYDPSLAIAFTPDGRPIVAAVDPYTGDLALASCDTPICEDATVSIVAHAGTRSLRGLELAVPAHGRPVIAYTPETEEHNGPARLLTCTAADCADADIVDLPDPGRWRPGPALGVDEDGELMVATFDHATGRLLLLACHDATCSDRDAIPLARAETDGTWRPGPVDLAVGDDGRPRLVWVDRGVTTDDDSSVVESRTRMLTCGQSGCRQGG